LSVEKLMDMMGVDENMLNQNIRPAAEYQVKNDLLLDAVVLEEKLEATAEEIEEFAKKMADNFGTTVDQLKSYFGEETLAEEVKKDKAGKLITDSAVAVAAAEEEKAEPKKTAKKAAKTEDGAEKPKRTRKKAEAKAEEEGKGEEEKTE
jgi:FKBP-type peptidyl-prolyl cis-trans isomerase (trigger factor)